MSIVGDIDDPAYVRRQYANEDGLAARKSVYRETTGPDARELAFAAVAEAQPERVLEVGCGEGELAARVLQELSADVVAVDQSDRMVALTHARGVNARVADVQDLPFGDRSFDVAVAAWMLYHAPDPDRALSELARVLRPRGRLVAATNRQDHLLEMWSLAGVERIELPFGAENAGNLLSHYFEHVEERDATGTVTFRDAESIRMYLRSSDRFAEFASRVPELAAPLVVRRRPVVFVADRPL